MGEKCFLSNVEEILPHGGHHGGAPWKRHGCAMSCKSAMEEIVSILTLRKLFHMGRHVMEQRYRRKNSILT